MASEILPVPLSLKPMLVAITGGIATGKSRVGDFLAQRGEAGILSADAACRALLQPGEPGWQGLRELLGADFFLEHGVLDRSRLRQHLFAEEALRQKVDALLHPLARQRMLREAQSLVADGRCQRLLVEVPLLFEAGWQDDYAQVVVVSADQELCVKRLMRRDGVSRVEALQAIAAQMPLAEKARRADFVVDNSGDWEDTRLLLEALLPLLWPDRKKKS